MSETVLLVGCGNMGRAMLEGWLATKPSLAAFVVEPADALRDRAAQSALAEAQEHARAASRRHSLWLAAEARHELLLEAE